MSQINTQVVEKQKERITCSRLNTCPEGVLIIGRQIEITITELSSLHVIIFTVFISLSNCHNRLALIHIRFLLHLLHLHLQAFTPSSSQSLWPTIVQQSSKKRGADTWISRHPVYPTLMHQETLSRRDSQLSS
jgi:hypothetical protein